MQGDSTEKGQNGKTEISRPSLQGTSPGVSKGGRDHERRTRKRSGMGPDPYFSLLESNVEEVETLLKKAAHLTDAKPLTNLTRSRFKKIVSQKYQRKWYFKNGKRDWRLGN